MFDVQMHVLKQVTVRWIHLFYSTLIWNCLLGFFSMSDFGFRPTMNSKYCFRVNISPNVTYVYYVDGKGLIEFCRNTRMNSVEKKSFVFRYFFSSSLFRSRCCFCTLRLFLAISFSRIMLFFILQLRKLVVLTSSWI